MYHARRPEWTFVFFWENLVSGHFDDLWLACGFDGLRVQTGTFAARTAGVTFAVTHRAAAITVTIGLRHRRITDIGTVDHLIAFGHLFVVLIDIITFVAIGVVDGRRGGHTSMFVMIVLMPIGARFLFARLLVTVMTVRVAAVRMLAVRFERMIRTFGGTLIELWL